MKPKVSVLLAARKNSKYLAKFIFDFIEKTAGFEKGDVELLVMVNSSDEWNQSLIDYFERNEDIHFFFENDGLGRDGLHEYFNNLAGFADGEWIIYFCEDHNITKYGWDEYFIKKIKEWDLDYRKPYCLIPKFWNVGAMNQMISRGYYEALGGVLGRHGNIDSYINDINRGLGGKLEKEVVRRFDDETFYDFTHDQPSQLDDSRTKTQLSERGKLLPKYSDHVITEWVNQDSLKIKKACDELSE